MLIARWIRADEIATDARGWALDLAVFRVVLLGTAVLPFAWHALRWTERIMPGLPREAWVPVSFFAWLPPDVLTSVPLARGLAVANVACIALALLGIRTRWTLGAATLLSLHVFGLLQNIGKVDHYHHLVWFMALAAVGPSAHALSVDSLRGRGASAAAPRGALATLRCIWILLGLVYLGPGAAKLASAVASGWATADNLHLILWSQWFARNLYQPGFTPPLWVEMLPSWLLVAGGLGVIAFETTFVWLVLLRPVRPFLAAAGVLFHLGTGLVLGIWFAFLVPAYAALIDWSALGRALGWRPGPSPAPAATGGRSAVVALGATLVAAQAVVSVLRLVAPAWPVPVWPFDCYPTFARPRPAETAIWEPRAVLADGREVRVSAHAWAATFGSPARCARIAEGVLGAPVPERRARSREVVAALWPHEAPAVRDAALGVAVYEARYALAAIPRLVGATLLDRVPVSGPGLAPREVR